MKAERKLKSVILIGLFAVPFIPFLVSDSILFPFIAGKNFAFRFLIEIIFGAWAILAIRDSSYRPRWGMLAWLILAFVGFAGLATIFSEDPYKSFWSNFERMEGYVTVLHLLAYFVVATSVLKTKELWSRFFNTSILASVLISFYGLVQLAGWAEIHQGGVRLDATFGNAIYLAVYVLMHIFLALFLAVRSFRIEGINFKTYLYSVAILLEGLILYYTATRGAILGLIGGLVISGLIIVFKEQKNSQVRRVAGAGLLIVAILIGGFLLIRKTDFVTKSPVLNRFASISLEDNTTKSRFLIWNMAWQGFKERPVLGWGQESFNYVFNEYYNPKMYAQEQWFDRAHNVFLDWLIAGGLPTFILYLSLYVASIFLLWRKKFVEAVLSVSEKAVLTGLIVAYFINNLFVFDNLGSYIIFFAILAYLNWLLTASAGHHAGSKKSGQKLALGNSNLKQAAVPAIILVVIFSVYFFNAKAYFAGQTLIEALKTNESGLTQNLKLFEKALAYESFADSEIREQFVQVASRIANSGTDIKVKQDYFSVANLEMDKQIKKNPNNTRHLVFRGVLLDNFKFSAEAVEAYKIALSTSPNKQTIMFSLGSAYISNNDPDSALEVLEMAFKLDENFDEARLFYAAGAIFAKRDDLVKQILEPRFGDQLVIDDRIINAYASVGRFDKVIEIWKAKIKLEPENSQYYLALAASYLQIGNRSEAVNQIRNAIGVNPEIKEQGEYYIREIEAGRNP